MAPLVSIEAIQSLFASLEADERKDEAGEQMG